MSLQEQISLNQAYQTASDVYKSARKTKGVIQLESQLIMDLSGLVLEAIDSIEMNEKISSSGFERLALYACRDAKSPLLKLGFSLTVLLQRLMSDRFAALAPQIYLPKPQDSLQSEPSTSGATALISEASDLIFPLTADKIKQEPVEIKMEEPDLFDEVEVKEEPMVDVFCPTTGDARPFDHSDIAMEDAGSMEDTKDQNIGNVLDNKLKIAQNVRNRLERIVENGGVSATHPIAQDLSMTTIQDPPGLSRECYLCGETTYRFYQTPVHKKRRDVFFDEIITHTKRDKIRISALKYSRDKVFFCLTHFAVGIQKTLPRLYQKDIIDDPVNPQCDICDQPEPPCIISPKKAVDAQRFFENLIDLTPEQQDKVGYYLYTANTRAKICMKHFIKETVRRSLMDSTAAPSLTLVDVKKLRAGATLVRNEQKAGPKAEENPRPRYEVVRTATNKRFDVVKKQVMRPDLDKQPIKSFDLVKSTTTLMKKRQLRKTAVKIDDDDDEPPVLDPAPALTEQWTNRRKSDEEPKTSTSTFIFGTPIL